jgi:hypothetical protein
MTLRGFLECHHRLFVNMDEVFWVTPSNLLDDREDLLWVPPSSLLEDREVVS